MARADVLSDLLDIAFDALFWISEAPNRDSAEGATDLAVRAREACARIEREDPDREHTGP